MKFSDLAKKDNKEIETILLERRGKLAHLKFHLSLKKVKNTAEIKQIRKDIARILTILEDNKNLRKI